MNVYVQDYMPHAAVIVNMQGDTSFIACYRRVQGNYTCPRRIHMWRHEERRSRAIPRMSSGAKRYSMTYA